MFDNVSIGFEALTMTECSEGFSCDQSCKCRVPIYCFRDYLCLRVDDGGRDSLQNVGLELHIYMADRLRIN
jgi:hypothetical protein